MLPVVKTHLKEHSHWDNSHAVFIKEQTKQTGLEYILLFISTTCNAKDPRCLPKPQYIAREDVHRRGRFFTARTIISLNVTAHIF